LFKLFFMSSAKKYLLKFILPKNTGSVPGLGTEPVSVLSKAN